MIDPKEKVEDQVNDNSIPVVSDELFNMVINKDVIPDTPPIETNANKTAEEYFSGVLNDDDNKQIELDNETKSAKLIYDTLVAKEILAPLEEDTFSAEMLEKELETLPEKVLTSFLDGSPAVAKDLIAYAANLPIDATKEDLKKFFDQVVEPETTQVNLENPDSARDYLFSTYRKTMSEAVPNEAIEAVLDHHEKKGSILSEAKKQYDLQKSEAQRIKTQELLQAEQNRRDREENIKTFNSLVIKSIEDKQDWNQKRKQVVKEQFNTQTLQAKMDVIKQTPELMSQFLDFVSFLDLDKKQFTFEKNYVSEALNKQTQSIRDNLHKDRFSTIVSKGGYIDLNKASNKLSSKGFKPATFRKLS